MMLTLTQASAYAPAARVVVQRTSSVQARSASCRQLERAAGSFVSSALDPGGAAGMQP